MGDAYLEARMVRMEEQIKGVEEKVEMLAAEQRSMTAKLDAIQGGIAELGRSLAQFALVAERGDQRCQDCPQRLVAA